jgi:Protein of unknown function (DUF3313)
MSVMHTKFPLVLALGALFLAGCASTGQSQKTEWDGLVRQSGTRLNAVFVRPSAEAEIVAFRNVLIDPVSVSFARDFDPNRRSRGAQRLDSDDLAAIKENLAATFREVFREELASGGYALVDKPGPETLRVTAAIVDLFINAPDTMSAGRSRTYTANSGRMTLVVELRDSDTNELLARAVDTRTGRGTGTFTVTNRVTNTADARRAIRVWAQALRQGLDDLYKRAG